jgi:hypothetical protein
MAERHKCGGWKQASLAVCSVGFVPTTAEVLALVPLLLLPRTDNQETKPRRNFAAVLALGFMAHQAIEALPEH